ncbi:unnamed protein product [Camellia sinensis]
MSPSKFHGDDPSRREINGPRPSPLRINKDSHSIQKPSSSSYPRTSDHQTHLHQHQQQHQQQQNPVIIYAHSPRIIHTQPRDFMALVQKLTGLSSSSAPQAQNQPRKNGSLLNRKDEIETKGIEIEDKNESSSGNITDDDKFGLSPSTFNLNDVPNQYLADIPLFTPNSSNLFMSPRPLYRYVDSMFPSPNMGSVFEAIKELPQY